MIKYERAREIYIKDSVIKDEAEENAVKLCGKQAKVGVEIRCSLHTCRHYFVQAQLRNSLDVYSLS